MGCMAKYIGDIPCVKLDKVHITINAQKCLCGLEWHYSKPSRNGKCKNLIFRDIEAVTCEKCKEIYSLS